MVFIEEEFGNFLNAVQEGNYTIVKMLLNNNPTFLNRAEIDFGSTALLIAILNNWNEIVILLLESGVDVEKADCEGWSPLFLASNMGTVFCVKCLLDATAYVNRQDDLTGKTALIEAVQLNHFEIVKLLVEYSADVNLESKFGKTALLFSAANGNLEICEYLVSSGANVKKRDSEGNSALFLAATNNNANICKYLVESCKVDIDEYNHDILTPVYIATQKGNFEVFKYLINAGCDINQRFSCDISLLHLSVYFGHLNIVKYLIQEKSFDINLTAIDNATPVYCAVLNGHLEITRYLIGKGCKIEQNVDGNFSLLHIAAFNNYLDICKYLIEEIKVNVDEQSESNVTPVYCATENGHLNIVKYFIQKGCNVDVKTAGGFSLLHVAAYKNYLEIVKYLVEVCKFDVNTLNDAELSATYLAAGGGHYEIAKYLIDHGHDILKISDLIKQ